MFEAIMEQIRAHETIILHRHAHPDGDALGSQIGLKHIIQDNFPGKRVLMAGDAPKRYSFMADSAMDDIADADYAQALAIILDTSAPALISDSRYILAADTARIDHHIFIDAIARVEVVDEGFESCCGLITALAMENGLTVSLIAAQSLFTGMVTDSGRFRYDGTTAGTFERAAFLMRQPIPTGEIYRSLYAMEFEQLCMRAQYTLKIRFTPHRVAYIYTTLSELRRLPADAFTVSRGMVGVMADIQGVDIWVNFTETPEGVLCELRSGPFNINPIAAQYGGGGHAQASGATLRDRNEAMRMLSDLDDMVREAAACAK